MTTITKDYRTEQKRLHKGPYGASGHYWLGHVAELCDMMDCRSVLDYGAGKATLGPYLKRLGIKYAAYDPATFPKKPEGTFDLVVCLDVLEHVEEDCIEAVMDEIHAYADKAYFAVVSTRPSSKSLSDGRNAHITERPYEWWRDNHLRRGWKSGRVRQDADGFNLVGLRSTTRPGITAVTRSQINTLRGITK